MSERATHFPEYRATVYSVEPNEWFWFGDEEPHEAGPYPSKGAAVNAMAAIRLRLLYEHRDPLPTSGNEFEQLLRSGSWEVSCERLVIERQDAGTGDYLGEDDYDLEELTNEHLDALTRVVEDTCGGWERSAWPQEQRKRRSQPQHYPTSEHLPGRDGVQGKLAL